jgi:regulatory protein
MKITALRRQQRRPDRVNVYVDGALRLTVPEEVAIRAGLRVGLDVAEATLASLEALSAAGRAREAALALLSHRPRSERELRQRLRRRDLPEPAIDEAVSQLAGVGLVDDAAFALAFVRDRLRNRPRGRARLHAELSARGVAPEAAGAAISHALRESDTTELDLARRVAVRFRSRPGEERLRAERRLYGQLARRGFSADTIRQVVGETLR